MFNWPKSKRNQDNQDYSIQVAAARAAMQESGIEVCDEHPRYSEIVAAATNVNVGNNDSFADIHESAKAAALKVI